MQNRKTVQTSQMSLMLKEIGAKNIECIMSFEDIIVYSRPVYFQSSQKNIEHISHASVNDSVWHDS